MIPKIVLSNWVYKGPLTKMKKNWMGEPELSRAPIKYGSLVTDCQVEL